MIVLYILQLHFVFNGFTPLPVALGAGVVWLRASGAMPAAVSLVTLIDDTADASLVTKGARNVTIIIVNLVFIVWVGLNILLVIDVVTDSLQILVVIVLLWILLMTKTVLLIILLIAIQRTH